ncbi:MAG: metal ABC transporter substrate-binding protein [Verrucomicrobiota bacterium]
MKNYAPARILALTLCAAIAGCAADEEPPPEENKLRVTCTTTLMSSVVDAVGGDKVDVNIIVPFGMCPGHFDLTPGEADKLRNADMVLYHGFEQFLEGVETSPETDMIKAGVHGNWMIPAVHIRAIERIESVLVEATPGASEFFAKKADSYSRAVTREAQLYTKLLKPIQGARVVCAEMNRDLAEWMGLEVVAVFPRDEAVSVKALHRILTEGRKQQASLVIDNRQSSGKIGRTIADELNVPFAMLSNFPGTGSPVPGAQPYLAALSNNCSAVVNALKTEDE